MTRTLKLMYSSQRPLFFDGLQAVVWKIAMQNSVSQSAAQIRNISPGVLYTFIFVQDAIGGHAFDWPPSCLNAPSIDPRPNAKTVQNLIGYTGGVLLAVPTGSW